MKVLRSAVLLAMALVLGWRTAGSVSARSNLLQQALSYRQAVATDIRALDLPSIAEAKRLYLDEAGDRPTSTDVRQILAIVLGADSRKSHDSVKPWSAYLAKLHWEPHQELWIVVDRPHTGAQFVSTQALAAGARVRMLVMRDPSEFMRITGLEGVPVGILTLDGRLQMMVNGPVAATDLEALTDYLVSRPARYPANPFQFDREPDSLISPPNVQDVSPGVGRLEK